MNSSLYISAFIMGLLGSVHCIGMCGGITIALSHNSQKDKVAIFSLMYQCARILSYSILGAITASFTAFMSTLTTLPILPIRCGFFMIMLGLYLLNKANVLTALESLGRRLWGKLRPIQSRFIPIQKHHHALVVGLLWGFLPCGLVYSALALAATAGGAPQGFLTMMCFGLGTLPALLSLSLLSDAALKQVRKPFIRTLFGIAFIVWGLYFISSALGLFADHSNRSNSAHKHHISYINESNHSAKALFRITQPFYKVVQFGNPLV